MQRKKILWLVSWYPNKKDRFDGDFIQRHARAAAIYHDVHVIFVTDAKMEKETEEECNYAAGLIEQVVYFKTKRGFFERVRKQVKWRLLFQKAVKNYIAKNGLPDLVHVHVPWKAGLIALWVKKKYGKAFVVTEHWGIYNRIVENNFYTMPKFVQQLISRIFREARSFFSVSRFLANGVETLSGRNAEAIIPNVVDTTLFFHKAEKYSNFTFVHVSNMVPLKNVRGILDAFNQFLKNQSADAQLILVGNRDDEFVRYAETLGLLNSKVFFRGEVSYREVAEEMQLCHCLVLYSNMENSPCVIGESLCCGLPVIATSVGGIPELVHSSNSRLISAGDTEALSGAMKDVFHNYELFNPKQISEDAFKKFGYPAIAEKFRDLYNSFS